MGYKICISGQQSILEIPARYHEVDGPLVPRFCSTKINHILKQCSRRIFYLFSHFQTCLLFYSNTAQYGYRYIAASTKLKNGRQQVNPYIHPIRSHINATLARSPSTDSKSRVSSETGISSRFRQLVLVYPRPGNETLTCGNAL